MAIAARVQRGIFPEVTDVAPHEASDDYAHVEGKDDHPENGHCQGGANCYPVMVVVGETTRAEHTDGQEDQADLETVSCALSRGLVSICTYQNQV